MEVVKLIYKMYPKAVKEKDELFRFTPLGYGWFEGAHTNVMKFLLEKYPIAVLGLNVYRDNFLTIGELFSNPQKPKAVEFFRSMAAFVNLKGRPKR